MQSAFSHKPKLVVDRLYFVLGQWLLFGHVAPLLFGQYCLVTARVVNYLEILPKVMMSIIFIRIR